MGEEEEEEEEEKNKRNQEKRYGYMTFVWILVRFDMDPCMEF